MLISSLRIVFDTRKPTHKVLDGIVVGVVRSVVFLWLLSALYI